LKKPKTLGKRLTFKEGEGLGPKFGGRFPKKIFPFSIWGILDGDFYIWKERLRLRPIPLDY